MERRALQRQAHPQGREQRPEARQTSQVKVTDDKKGEIAKIEGLAGYVLGGQSRSWELPVAAGLWNRGAEINIEAAIGSEMINATALVGKGG